MRGDDEGVNYDTHEETVTITVTDDETGTLTATTSYDADGAKFENKTKPGKLTVSKKNNRKGNQNEEFEFEIRMTDDLGRNLKSIPIISNTDN